MTYGHAEATAEALVKFDIHFLTRDLTESGLNPYNAKQIAEHLVRDKGWTRKRDRNED